MGKARVPLFSLVRSGLELVVVRPVKVNLVFWEPSYATLVSNSNTLLENTQLPRAGSSSTPQSVKNNDDGKRVQGRVYSLTTQDAQVTNTVVMVYFLCSLHILEFF